MVLSMAAAIYNTKKAARLLKNVQRMQQQQKQCYCSSSKRKSQAPGQQRPETTPATENPGYQQQNSSETYFFSILAWRLAMAYGGIYYISEYVFQLTNCDGPSMLPTFQSSGEIILVDRLTPRLYGLQGGSSAKARIQEAKERQKKHHSDNNNADDEWHVPMVPANEFPSVDKWKLFWANLRTGISVGDVVVVEHPRREGTVCKRVLGLPGDEIILRKSQYSDISLFFDEQGKRRRIPRTLRSVPDGHIWVEGDNSSNSLDSRTYGTIPASMIVGRVPFRVWPLRGDAMVLRGMRPKPKLGEPRWGAQGSTVLPAGYEGQSIVKTYRQQAERN